VVVGEQGDSQGSAVAGLARPSSNSDTFTRYVCNKIAFHLSDDASVQHLLHLDQALSLVSRHLLCVFKISISISTSFKLVSVV
jgi:hypothetical protein